MHWVFLILLKKYKFSFFILYTQRMCELHGGYLVRVESAEEQAFVQNLIQGLHGNIC